jgi:hypothetical protein
MDKIHVLSGQRHYLTLYTWMACYGLSGVWASWDIYLHADRLRLRPGVTHYIASDGVA